jgi:hypothetical protein
MDNEEIKEYLKTIPDETMIKMYKEIEDYDDTGFLKQDGLVMNLHKTLFKYQKIHYWYNTALLLRSEMSSRYYKIMLNK